MLNKVIWNALKKQIFISMIPANSEELDNYPHFFVDNMAAIFVAPSRDGYCAVKKNIQKNLDIPWEDLYNAGIENTEKTLVFEPVKDLLAIYDLETTAPLWCATNCNCFLGAGVISTPKMYQLASKEFGQDFWIIPSSIHEILLLPDTGDLDPEFLTGLMQVVNNSDMLDPHEVLSDTLYHYDIKHQLFEPYDMYRRRTTS